MSRRRGAEVHESIGIVRNVVYTSFEGDLRRKKELRMDHSVGTSFPAPEKQVITKFLKLGFKKKGYEGRKEERVYQSTKEPGIE